VSLAPLDIITLRQPKFAANSGVTTYITLATPLIAPRSDTSWADDNTYALAVALMAMHMMQLDATRLLGEGGAVLSKKEGDTEERFSDNTNARKPGWVDPDLTQTAWGRQLMGLAEATFIPISVTGGPASGADWNYDMWDAPG
jgi:hypothetical protein